MKASRDLQQHKHTKNKIKLRSFDGKFLWAPKSFGVATKLIDLNANVPKKMTFSKVGSFAKLLNKQWLNLGYKNISKKKFDRDSKQK
jgi:hypothetical protein